jgi:hypothetical protein
MEVGQRHATPRHAPAVLPPEKRFYLVPNLDEKEKHQKTY